jgi:hypothetical protein
MIRLATRYDIPRLLEIVEAYAFENPITTLGRIDNHDPVHVEQLLFSIMQGKGFIYIDTSLRGAIIAIKQRNVWCPKVKELHELLWWVEPEYRNSTLGGRLWKAFDSAGTEMLDHGDIDLIVTSVSSKGPWIDYTKRDYIAATASFVKE